jgi:putative cell wall-binding protein
MTSRRAVASLLTLVSILGLAMSAPAPAEAVEQGVPRPVLKVCPITEIVDSGVTRIGGDDRFAVSAAVSAATFNPGVGFAYLASGANYPDALSGSAAAGAGGGPILLALKDSIPSVVEKELTRLHPNTMIVLGGTESISTQVELSLERFATNIVRYSGADRYEVSAATAARTFIGLTKTAYVASGAGFADALSASAAAGDAGAPVLLVEKDRVPLTVLEALRNLQGLERIVVLGGKSSIGDSVVAELAEIARTNRIAGADRFEVSAAASADEFCRDRSTVYVASGTVFPDALSGSAAAIHHGSPVLLVTKDAIPGPVSDELHRLNPRRIVVLGGSNTVSDTTLSVLAAYLSQ